MRQNRETSKDPCIAAYQEPPKKNSFKPLQNLILVLFFFTLPAFAVLHTKGILLWLVFVSFFIFYALSNGVPRRFELTESELRQYTVGSRGEPLRISLVAITGIREYGGYIRIRIPKKTYLIYTGSAHHPFAERLMTQHTRIKEAENKS